MSSLLGLMGGTLKPQQSGTILIADGATSQTATISAVDTSKCTPHMLGFRQSNSSGVNQAPMLELTNSTTITVSREGNTGTVRVSWTLEERY